MAQCNSYAACLFAIGCHLVAFWLHFYIKARLQSTYVMSVILWIFEFLLQINEVLNGLWIWVSSYKFLCLLFANLSHLIAVSSQTAYNCRLDPIQLQTHSRLIANYCFIAILIHSRWGWQLTASGHRPGSCFPNNKSCTYMCVRVSVCVSCFMFSMKLWAGFDISFLMDFVICNIILLIVVPNNIKVVQHRPRTHTHTSLSSPEDNPPLLCHVSSSRPEDLLLSCTHGLTVTNYTHTHIHTQTNKHSHIGAPTCTYLISDHSDNALSLNALSDSLRWLVILFLPLALRVHVYVTTHPLLPVLPPVCRLRLTGFIFMELLWDVHTVHTGGGEREENVQKQNRKAC